MKNISPVPLRSSPPPVDDPGALFEEYRKTRDVRVRNRLVMHYERLVSYLASRYATSRLAASEDLMQIGYIGLIAAIERYEPEKQVSFAAYATPTIIGNIKHYLRDHTWAVRVPRGLSDLGLRVRGLRTELDYNLGRPCSDAELAEAAGITEAEVREASAVLGAYRVVPLDGLSSTTESEGSVAEMVGMLDPGIRAIEEKDALRDAFSRLDMRTRRILYLRFEEGLTQLEVAGRLGLSQMHVSRIERRALQDIRERLKTP